MTNNDEARLESEYDELDIPYLSADAVILALTETMSRDEFFAAFDNAADWNAHGKMNAAATLIARILDEAIDSSLQIAHIRRGLEIQFELSDIAEQEN